MAQRRSPTCFPFLAFPSQCAWCTLQSTGEVPAKAHRRVARAIELSGLEAAARQRLACRPHSKQRTNQPTGNETNTLANGHSRELSDDGQWNQKKNYKLVKYRIVMFSGLFLHWKWCQLYITGLFALFANRDIWDRVQTRTISRNSEKKLDLFETWLFFAGYSCLRGGCDLVNIVSSLLAPRSGSLNGFPWKALDRFPKLQRSWTPTYKAMCLRETAEKSHFGISSWNFRSSFGESGGETFISLGGKHSWRASLNHKNALTSNTNIDDDIRSLHGGKIGVQKGDNLALIHHAQSSTVVSLSLQGAEA